MKLDFSVGLGRNEPLNEIGDYARLAEECGFSHVTWVDMPPLSPEVNVMMTLAAQATKRIKIGHGVTTPSTYHPMVIANGTATVDEISGGRAFIGLGAGGDFGDIYRPATVKDVREAVIFLRDYMSGNEAHYKNAKMHSEWIKRPVPIYMAAEGPKMLQLAGELADGVISIGTNPELVKWKLKQVEIGAKRAGRDPSTIDYWVRCMIYVADSKQKAKAELSPYPVAYGLIHKFLDGSMPSTEELPIMLEKSQPGITEEIMADSKRVRSAWDPYGVERLDAPWVGYVTQELIDFFHIVGTVGEVRDKITKLGELGARNISPVMFTIRDKKAMMKEIGRSIIPAFQK